MTKFLDLDAFAPKLRTLKLNGKEYEVSDPLDLPYDEFLKLLTYERKAMKFEAAALKWWERLIGRKPKAAPVMDSENQMVAIAEQIRVLAPSIPREELLRLPLAKLSKLLAWTKGLDGGEGTAKNG